MFKGKPNPKPKISPFIYTRANHFANTLDQLFPKKLNIHKDDYEKIVMEVAQMKKDKSSLKAVDIKMILKKLGLPKYYEYTPYLAHRFNSDTNLTINKSVEQQLISKFIEVSASFNKLSDQGKFGSRKNFLSYQYILHKLCQLEGLDELDKYIGFQMFSKEKLQFHDKMWYDVCKDLGWKFMSTNMTNMTYDKPKDKSDESDESDESDKLGDRFSDRLSDRLDEELEDLDELVKSIVIII
jgi:hypothetical protein